MAISAQCSLVSWCSGVSGSLALNGWGGKGFAGSAVRLAHPRCTIKHFMYLVERLRGEELRPSVLMPFGESFGFFFKGVFKGISVVLREMFANSGFYASISVLIKNPWSPIASF